MASHVPAPSSIATRRSVPQLPPILTTSFSNSLLDTSSPQLEMMTRSTQSESLGTRTMRVSKVPNQTPLPTPAQLPATSPVPPVPHRTSSISKPKQQPQVARRSSSVREPTALLSPDPQPATKQTKLRKSKSASLFNLFSRPKFERSRASKDQGLSSKNLPERPIEGPAQHLVARSPSAATNRTEKIPKRQGMLSVEEVPPQRPTTATETKARASSRVRRKDAGSTDGLEAAGYHHSSWRPPPLFQAYPQSIKHITLEAVQTNDSSSRVKLALAENGSTSSHERPSSSKGGRQQSTSSAGGGEPQKTFVLATAGYLLQYAADGSYDRLPEKILKLASRSAAFASDVIQGKHWVLQVVQDMNDLSTKSAMAQTSLLSKLSFHHNTGKSVSTMLLIFDNPSEMDTWMSTIRREIDVLAGRTPKASHTDAESANALPTTTIPLRRYQSITRNSMLEVSPVTSPVLRSLPNSPTLFSPPSPGLPQPASPVLAVSTRGSQSTTLVGTGSEWSSSRSSYQQGSNRPSESSYTRFSQIQESPSSDHPPLRQSTYMPILEYCGPNSPVKEIVVSHADAHTSSSTLASSPTWTEKPVQSAPSSPLKAEIQVVDYSYHDMGDDATSPVDEADERENEALLGVVADTSGGTSPLPSPMLNSFPQPHAHGPADGLTTRYSGRSSFGPSILSARKTHQAENTPYFRQRLPDPQTIVEEDEDIISTMMGPDFDAMSTTSSTFTAPSSVARPPLLPLRAYDSEPWAFKTPPRSSQSLVQGRVSAFQALTGEAPLRSPDNSPPSDLSSKAGRRTSIMRSSTTPLPLRSSMLASQATQPDSPPSLTNPAKDPSLRRPPSMQVNRDQAPFVTTVRAHIPSWESTSSNRSSVAAGRQAGNRSSSAARTPASKRSSVLVPVVRPPSVRPSVRSSKAFDFGPPQPPPSAPLPQPPPPHVSA